MNMDQDYVVGDSMRLQQHQRMNAVTEELAVRTRGEGRWQWATGVFGSHVDMMTDAPVTFRPDMNQMLARMILGFLPATHRDMFTTWEIPYFYVPETFETPQTNLGAFHESNVKLTDRLTATLGLRFDFSKTKIDYEVNARMDLHYAAQMGPRVIEASNALTDSLMGHGSKTSRQLLPKVGLTYRIDDHGSNVYAQVSKGYRAGGYNIQMFNYIVRNEMMANGSQLNRTDYNIPHDETSYAHVNETLEYEPETSWNYEVGSHLNLLDGKLQADLSTYFMRVSDLQLSKMAGVYGFGRMMVNAGKSNHCGIEAALRGTVLDNRLAWAATYSYTHAVFKEYKDTIDNQEVDYKSKHVPYVPLHAFSAMADYRFDVAGDAVLRSVTVGLNVAGQGKTYWDEANTAAQKLYATLGGHVRLDMGCVDVDVWGRNLTDTEYCTFGLAYANRYFGQRGLPLQAGIDVRLHF
jgi:outer membrane receptor protein involved in Fe transport